MKNNRRHFLAGVLWLIIFVIGSPLLLFAGPNKTENELIQMLYSGDYYKINDALDRLPDWYPNSTNAVQIIRGILRSNEVMIVNKTTYQPSSTSGQGHGGKLITVPVSHNSLARIAAKSLGKYHATLDENELNIIYQLMDSHDEECAMDGLKALRGLNAPQAVPKILPLLEDDQNAHVVRDALRTLAVLGNTNTIPFIEPLLKSSRSDVRWDAYYAIKALRAKQ